MINTTSHIGARGLLVVVSIGFAGCSREPNAAGPINAGSVEPGQAASFQGLGHFAPGWPSYAYGISGDGSAVVGVACDATACSAFRWTSTTGMVNLGPSTWWAAAATFDGRYAVGRASDATQPQPYGFRWNPVGGIEQLPIFEALDVSDDGSVIVCCALRWNNGTVTSLGSLGACCTQARGVSGDGIVVVGSARSSVYGTERAFRWTEATGIQDLGRDGVATAASGNGAVITGRMKISDTRSPAFRWTAAEGFKDLGTLGGNSATPRGISADGSVIVGHSSINTSSAQFAFRWTTKKQLQDLKRELLDAGVTEVQGWRTLEAATGVSADGTVIVGYGINPNGVLEAFRAALPLP